MKSEAAQKAVEDIRKYLDDFGGFDKVQEFIKPEMPYIEVLKPAMNVITAFYPDDVYKKKRRHLFKWLKTEVSYNL